MSEPGGCFCLIPARGGSKGIAGKNLAPLLGRPLLAYTVEAALGCPGLGRVLVSTDDPGIARIARELGAEAPFLRPAELARDQSPALAVMRHAIEFLAGEGQHPGAMAYLQPTSPLRRAEHISDALDLFFESKADCVVSVVEVPHNCNPVSVMRLVDGELKPFLDQGPQPQRRQEKPKLYARNGPAVFIGKTERIMNDENLYQGRVTPYVMAAEDSVDIDTPFDLELAAWLLRRRGG